jgi:hypothetical protein
MIGVAVWSLGMGGQYALVRALVPERVPAARRGAAFGWFNTIFGVCWFLGSTAKGLLYGQSLPALVWFSVGLQLAAIPVVAGLWWSARYVRGNRI